MDNTESALARLPPESAEYPTTNSRPATPPPHRAGRAATPIVEVACRIDMFRSRPAETSASLDNAERAPAPLPPDNAEQPVTRKDGRAPLAEWITRKVPSHICPATPPPHSAGQPAIPITEVAAIPIFEVAFRIQW